MLKTKMNMITAEMGFVNLLKMDIEYLSFTSDKVNLLDKSLLVYWIYDETPIFSYEEIENSIAPIGEENAYVPYTEVKENEFSSTSEEGMKVWEWLQKQNAGYISKIVNIFKGWNILDM